MSAVSGTLSAIRLWALYRHSVLFFVLFIPPPSILHTFRAPPCFCADYYRKRVSIASFVRGLAGAVSLPRVINGQTGSLPAGCRSACVPVAVLRRRFHHGAFFCTGYHAFALHRSTLIAGIALADSLCAAAD
jgi:hypothetical protein